MGEGKKGRKKSHKIQREDIKSRKKRKRVEESRAREKKWIVKV